MKSRNPIAAVFGRSPIKPLQKHMERVQRCVKTLVCFFSPVFTDDWQKAIQLQKEVISFEHQADELKKDLRAHLPKSLFLPFSRGDLLVLLQRQDKIANLCKDIAGIVIGRKMHIPKTLQTNYLHLLTRSADAVAKAYLTVNELDELLETGFRGAEVTIIEEMLQDIHLIEHDTDEIQIHLRQDLFALEAELSPVDVIFLYKVLHWTGELADNAEQIAYLIESFLAH